MAAHQAPLSLGFSRQEYWSGVPLPSPLHHFSLYLMLLRTVLSALCNITGICYYQACLRLAVINVIFEEKKIWFPLWNKGCGGGLVTKSCALCDPMDCSPPDSSVRGISQARILEWGAVSFSRESSWPRDQTYVSCIASGFFTAEPPGKPLK